MKETYVESLNNWETNPKLGISCHQMKLQFKKWIISDFLFKGVRSKSKNNWVAIGSEFNAGPLTQELSFYSVF